MACRAAKTCWRYRTVPFRYFTIRESARLQTFPDSFVFPNSWTESMRQIGNAVPVLLAESIAGNSKRPWPTTKLPRPCRMPLQSAGQAQSGREPFRGNAEEARQSVASKREIRWRRHLRDLLRWGLCDRTNLLREKTGGKTRITNLCWQGGAGRRKEGRFWSGSRPRECAPQAA